MATTREIIMYVLILILGYLSYLVVKPFLSAMILGLLFAFLFYPVYIHLQKHMWSSAAAVVVMSLALLAIIIPSVYVGGQFIGQAAGAVEMAQESGISDESSIAVKIEEMTGLAVYDQVIEVFSQGKKVLQDAIPSIITRTGWFLLGLFMMFFIMYFALKEGDKWFSYGTKWLPLGDKESDRIMILMKSQAKALIYGQILTSILIGVVVGAIFWLFNVPNYVFWAIMVIVLGIIPVLGAFIVYVPIGVFMIVQGQWVNGILLIALSTGFQLFIDNILRPKLVSKASKIHPTLVILGALGGIYMMGIVGFLVGPLILSFFLTLMKAERT